MFRALLCPSLGARDYDVDFLIGRVILGLLCVGGKVQLGWSSVRVSGLRKDTVSIVQEAGWAPTSQRISMPFFYCLKEYCRIMPVLSHTFSPIRYSIKFSH